jgi:ABC-type nitrate/sulfonate/bicarbonate transport system substrate-binding protein/nicotinamidase-related amidase
MAEGLAGLHARGFGNRVGFGSRPALIVIDFAVNFTTPDRDLGADVSAEIDQANRLIAAARHRGAPVYFSAIAYDEPDCADAGLWARKMRGLRELVAGSSEVEQDPRLDREPSDRVIQKKFASCFFATDLASELRSKGIDTLIIAGCTTSGCVRATAVDACQLGFHTIVAREAVADRLKAAHDQSLIDIDLKYGDVLSVDAILAELQRIAGLRPAQFAVTRRGMLGLTAGALGVAAGMRPAHARDRVRVGLATKTWWPSVVAETAVSRGLFEKASLEAELTVYRGGSEAFEALAAGAADIIISVPSLVATGRARGVKAKIVACGGTANSGWKLMTLKNSPIKDVSGIAGKKVGITSAGSLSDFMALWTRSQFKLDFTSVPLGGGGLVPNLLARNVDAAIIYSPLSFQVLKGGGGRELLDYVTAIPPHLNSGWVATDEYIATKKDLVKRTLSALYSSLAYLQQNREAAAKILAEVNSIESEIAQQEYEETILKLSVDGRMTPELAEAALELARIGGMTQLAPAHEIFTNEFTPVSSST